MSRKPIDHDNFDRKNLEDARRFFELRRQLAKDGAIPSDGTVFTLIRADEPDGHD